MGRLLQLLRIASRPCSLGVGRLINSWERALRLAVIRTKDCVKVFCATFSKRLTVHQHHLSSTFSKFSSAEYDALKNGFTGLNTLTSGFVDAAPFWKWRQTVPIRCRALDLFVLMPLLVHLIPSLLMPVWLVRLSR